MRGKKAIKCFARSVAAVFTAPLWLLVRAEFATTRTETWFSAGAELLSLIPGRTGEFFRRAFYRMTLEFCAAECCVGFGTMLTHPQTRIGHRVFIGGRCMIGKAVIEDDVAIGSNVDVLSGRHQHNFDLTNRPILEQGGTFTPVRIGCNSWIGNSAVIMADIGEGCVVGAGSVVVKPVPARSVVVGNPARVVRIREPSEPSLHEARSDADAIFR
jgi:acetyltransferase-like isoleucine patch superfamily enzyme